MSVTDTQPGFVPTGRTLGFGGTIHAEWVKLRSLRSTWWVLGSLLAVTVGVGAQVSSSLSFDGVPGVVSQDARQDLGVYSVTVSTDFTALIVGVLGVLVITGEYGTGTIRSAFTAVPGRLPMLWAKVLVFAGAAFVVSAASFAVAVPISVGLLAGNGVEVRLDDPHYWSAVLGSTAYLVLVGVTALSIGALLRSTSGAIALTFGLFLAAPLALSLILGISPPDWAQNLMALLPSIAGKLLFSYPSAQNWVDLSAPSPDGSWLSEPWQGLLVLIGWSAVLLTAAAVLLRRRDA
ncbi:ABC transporter permease [Agromyces protaetiae]|uniref:ABC transporter permease n=1 Tax=Agromyces protaetiae TaxID=2509455 RepID=A0A4P6FCB6_9MICO|nr:ABC transporter permease subunit [Agromyces protaetiae]QAY73425.1 ABC transporter permease [Agromyces protaetiae]